MAKETIDTGRNKVDVDLEKYTDLVLKLDEAQDKIREMEKITKELKIATKSAQPTEKFSFGALFRDENDINEYNEEQLEIQKNDINEKSIIGFASFVMMLAFGIVDLVTGFWGKDIVISDTIYTSFVVVTLGAFGIAEAGKAFSKQSPIDIGEKT